MPILSTDILRKYTVKTGAAGNATAGTAAGSLGKYISTTQIGPDATVGNLFDDITGDENAAGEAEYRCEGVHNAHASLTWQNPVAWIVSEVAGGASVALSVDTTAAAALGSAAAQFKEVVDENTAPAGQTFSSPTTKGAGLALGNLPNGQVKGLWHRRTAANTAAINSDGAVTRIEGDTAA